MNGYGDVIIGADSYGTHRGRIYILYGNVTMDNIPDVKIAGESDGLQFGSRVSDAGDINNDGFDDVIVFGLAHDIFRGKAFIYKGGNSMDTLADITITGENTLDFFGNCSNAGDLNGDGNADILISANGFDSRRGRAYIYTAITALKGSVNIKVIVEGFYDFSSDKMRMSDTVKVYFRNSTPPYAISDSAVSIVDLSSFTGSFRLNTTASGNYYLDLKHRNSIRTWSSTPVNVAFNLTSDYSFIADSAQAYGKNMKRVTPLFFLPIRFAIYSGDVNQDDIIDAGDLSLVDNDAFNSVSGYVSTDVNGDDFVDASDISIVDNNVFNGVIVRNPIVGDAAFK